MCVLVSKTDVRILSASELRSGRGYRLWFLYEDLDFINTREFGNGKVVFLLVKFFLDFVDGVLLLQLFVNTFVGKKRLFMVFV